MHDYVTNLMPQETIPFMLVIPIPRKLPIFEIPEIGWTSVAYFWRLWVFHVIFGVRSWKLLHHKGAFEGNSILLLLGLMPLTEWFEPCTITWRSSAWVFRVDSKKSTFLEFKARTRPFFRGNSYRRQGGFFWVFTDSSSLNKIHYFMAASSESYILTKHKKTIPFSAAIKAARMRSTN